MAVRRILALAIALLLVAGALALRSSSDDDDAGGRDDGGPATTTAAGGGLRLTCVRELATVCRDLAAQHPEVTVVVADGLATVDALVAGSAPPDTDGWLTLAPLPAMVDGARDRVGDPDRLGPATTPLARSPLVIVAWDDRAGPLASACGTGVAWPCVGERAGAAWSELGGQAGWGVLKPGHARPDASASGLLVLAQAVVARAGTTDVAGPDLEGGPLRAWLRQLERAVPTVAAPGATPLAQALAAGPAAYDLVGTTEAEAAPTLARSARGGELGILYPAPMATADVVYAPVVGAPGATALAELLTGDTTAAALAAGGWRTPDDPRADLPAGTGLPPADLLEALRVVWSEVVR